MKLRNKPAGGNKLKYSEKKSINHKHLLMKIHLYLFFVCFTLLGHAQNTPMPPARSEESMISQQLKDDEQDVDGDPRKKEVLLLQLKLRSEKLNYTRGILQSGSKLMRLYSDQGRYREIVKLADQLKKRATDKKDPDGLVSTIYRTNASALGYLGLDDASLEDFRTAIKYAETIGNRDYRLYILSLCYQNMNVYFEKKLFENKKYGDSTVYYLHKSLELAKQIRDDNGMVSNSWKYDQIAFNDMRLGMYYLGDTEPQGNLEQAEKYLLEGAKIYENKEYDILPNNKIMMLNQLSWLYLEKKDYKLSINHAKRAMELEKQYRDPYHRVESYEFLASSYLETGEKEKSKYYMNRYTLLKDSLNLADKKNADLSMKEMVSEVDSKHKMLSQRQWILTGVIFLIIASNKNGIANETEKELLARLENFENLGMFLKKDITLTSVSTMFSTNTKYLSEIIKKYRSQNFSNYINSLRIDYIVHKLYSEPRYRDYKISYLADQCGFATYQVFILAFRKQNGVTPSYFIQNLKDDKVMLKD